MWMSLSSVASLDRRRRSRTIRRAPNQLGAAIVATVNTSVHRFEESIAGHPYLIEVAAVAENRWRAYIVRIPGPPPAEAAGLLCQWLTRAHERAAASRRPSNPQRANG